MFTISDHRFNGRNVPNRNVCGWQENSYSFKKGSEMSVKSGGVTRVSSEVEINSVKPCKGNVNWLNHKKEVLDGGIFNKSRGGKPFEIKRPGFKTGTTVYKAGKPISSWDGVRNAHFRSGVGDRFIQRPGFMKEPVKGRDPGLFDKLSLEGVPDAGQLVRLSNDTIGQLNSVNTFDPTDVEWLRLYGQRKALGESEESILRNPPLGREQRIISKMRLPSLQSNEQKQIAAQLTQDITESMRTNLADISRTINNATTEQVTAMADLINIPLMDLAGLPIGIETLRAEVMDGIQGMSRHIGLPSLRAQEDIVRLLSDISAQGQLPQKVTIQPSFIPGINNPSTTEFFTLVAKGTPPDTWAITGENWKALDPKHRRALLDQIELQFIQTKPGRSFTSTELDNEKFIESSKDGVAQANMKYASFKQTASRGDALALIQHFPGGTIYRTTSSP